MTSIEAQSAAMENKLGRLRDHVAITQLIAN
jgi:hypothetical protein